jgi:hypothetical protein
MSPRSTFKNLVLLFLILRDSPTRFVDSCFFIKQLILVSVDIPKSDFEFCLIFVELLIKNSNFLLF